MKYIVERPELYYQSIEVEADSPEQAIQRANDEEGVELEDSFSYSHTLDFNYWKVFVRGESLFGLKEKDDIKTS